MNAAPDGHGEAEFVSSLSDYAQIFMFLRRFGPLLALQPVSLADLEEFFLTRKLRVFTVNFDGLV